MVPLLFYVTCQELTTRAIFVNVVGKLQIVTTFIIIISSSGSSSIILWHGRSIESFIWFLHTRFTIITLQHNSVEACFQSNIKMFRVFCAISAKDHTLFTQLPYTAPPILLANSNLCLKVTLFDYFCYMCLSPFK